MYQELSLVMDRVIHYRLRSREIMYLVAYARLSIHAPLAELVDL